MTTATVPRAAYRGLAGPRRRALLHACAMEIADGCDLPGPWLLAAGYSHPSLCAHELERACREYAAAVTAQGDLESDADLWAFYYPDLEGPGQRDAARQIAEDDVADMMGVLLHGRRT